MVTLGLVVAEYHRAITERMEEAALSAAEEHGAEVAETLRVPGAFDTPLAADRLARREAVDAVATLGCIVEGDTDHDEVIGHAATRGLTEVSLEHDTPVTLGITGPGMTADEARARVDYGAQAVESAVSLAEGL